MLQGILGFLGILPAALNTVNGITNAISNEKLAAISATTDKERIAAQERVATLQSQRDVMIADAQHSNWDIWMRSFIAIGPAAYIFKIFMWDKTLGAWTNGSTDPVTTEQWAVVTIMLGFYFLYSGAIGVAKIVKA